MIAPELATLAFCWRLERRDGIALGFTSHDRDLVFGGLTYRAAPGMLPSAIARSDDLDVDNVELTGALTSDAITAEDLAAGRWDGATLKLIATDWQDAGRTITPLVRGTLGAVAVSSRGFTVQLDGPTAALEAAVVETISPECRAELGDARCRVDLARHRRIVRVLALDGAVVTTDAAEPSSDAYGFGRLRWIEGANSGLGSAITASAGVTLTLAEPPHFAVTTPVRAEIIEGCDKRLATCAGRFANAVNFRGEPHVPGNDLLTRYPGS